MKTKLCRKCGRVLDTSAFSVDNHMHDHLSCYCKECVNAQNRDRLALKRAAIRMGLNPKLVKFTIADLVRELNARIIEL